MTVVDLYTIQIVRDDNVIVFVPVQPLSETMAETEENLTDLLPDGYSARIRRWDDPYPDEQPEPFVPDRYPEDTSPDALRASGWSKYPDEGEIDE